MLSHRSLPFVLLALASGCHESSSGGTPLPEGVTNLGVDASQARLADGVLAALVRENGADLNGDGDEVDALLEVLDLASGRRHVVPDVWVVQDAQGVGGGYVSYLVPEGGDGRDRNGDGDADDYALEVYEARTGRTVALRLAVNHINPLLAQDGALVAFGVRERDQGVDIDGDAELQSTLAYVYDADHRRLTPLEVAIADIAPAVSGRHVVLLADESRMGDLNGDADTLDGVVQVFDARTGRLQNLGRAAESVRLDGNVLAIGRQDKLVDLVDLESGLSVATPRASTFVAVGGDLAFVREEDENGIGLAFYDRLTGTLLEQGPFGVFFDEPALHDRRAAFLVDEAATGLDLDGDGVLQDRVLHTFDARTNTVTNVGVAVFSELVQDGTGVAFLAQHGPSPERPPQNLTVHVLDLAFGSLTAIGFERKAVELRFEGGRLMLLTPEDAVGVDLNDDGDLSDTVVQIHDMVTNTTTNTGLAMLEEDFPKDIVFEGDTLVFPASEVSQGVDLNGDGDRFDDVLHAVRLR